MTAPAPRIRVPRLRRQQHRNSAAPTLTLCKCCTPHNRHHFDEKLVCRCGTTWAEHQANPQKCNAPPQVRDGAVCKRGHPKREPYGRHQNYPGDGRWRWVCLECRRIENANRVRERKRRG